MLGCRGPSRTLRRALGGGEGHQLAEVNTFAPTLAGDATAAPPVGTLVCCLICGAYSQKRCQKLAKPCLGRSAGGVSNLRRIRAGLHPDYRSGLRLGSVSAKRAALSAAAVRAKPRHVQLASAAPQWALEDPRMRALRERIIAKEKASAAAR